MILDKRKVGHGQKPYFIAEMSGNHNHSLEKALEIVDAAAAAGADALKIQTYTPDTMTLNISEGEFFISDPKSLWKGSSLYDLYKVAMTPWEWHKPIQKRCQEKGITFFSTPFDSTAVDFLEDLNVPFYKIASFENGDLPLIKKIAQTKKPIIISTGMASLIELQEAVETARENGASDLILLKCTSAYPAKATDANLTTIKNIRETFGVEVGLSDHTMGWTVPIVAATLGASVIEKHFTIRRSDGGVDSAFSMEPHEFQSMIKEVSDAVESIGRVSYGVTEAEKKSLLFKRSIYFVKEIFPGEVITDDHVRIIRPGYGLAPKFFDMVVGRKASGHYRPGTAVNWDRII